MRLTPLLAALLVLGVGCSRNPAPEGAPTQARPQPLAGLAGEAVVVLPTRFLRVDSSLAAAAADLPRGRALLDSVDAALRAAAQERGIGSSWSWPEEMIRLARRNPTFAPDPRVIAAEPLRPRPRRRRGEPEMLIDPLRTQLRSLVALREGRYAIVPVELRLEPRGGGTGRAVLHLAVVDARLATVTWAGDVAGGDADALTPALALALGERFADLFAAR